MRTSVINFAFLTLGLVACGSDDHSNETVDAATTQPDAPAQGGTCHGTGDHFVFDGPQSVDTVNFGMVTVNGKVGGVAGAASTSELISFNPRDIVHADLERLGDHDVAVESFTSLRATLNDPCATGTTSCTGFYALAGTYTVIAVHPRYQATFTLSDLRERHDNSGTMGAAIAGAITGCVDHDNP